MATPDVWQKLSDTSGLVSAIVVALIGGAATYVLTQRQRKSDENKANRELAVHRVQIVQAFIANLGSEDEREKKAALLAISALGDVDLAGRLAELYGGEGSAAAMSRIASTSTGAEASKAEESLAVLFDPVRHSIVRVDAPAMSESLSISTGFVVAPNRIVTASSAATAIEPGDSLVIRFRDGTETHGSVLRLDEQIGLALIEADTADLPPLKISVVVGFHPVTVIGYGDGYEQVRSGYVVEHWGSLHAPGESVMLANVASSPGLGGAPALGEFSLVVGVVRGQIRKPTTLTILIPGHVVRDFAFGPDRDP